jgi:hypothetical protein
VVKPEVFKVDIDYYLIFAICIFVTMYAYAMFCTPRWSFGEQTKCQLDTPKRQ